MLRLKSPIDSACPTQGDSQEPCPTCRCSSHHHNNTYNLSQKGQFQEEKKKNMFGPHSY